jgi:hypothetical protein
MHLKEGGTTTEVVHKLQQSIDMWEGGLAATGGQLEPSKTFWYNIDFKWSDGCWRYAQIAELPSELSMEKDKGGRTILDRVEVNEGRRTLGMRLAPDGNNAEEFQYLRSQCDTWADKIRSGILPRTTIWVAFTSTILAKWRTPCRQRHSAGKSVRVLQEKWSTQHYQSPE